MRDRIVRSLGDLAHPRFLVYLMGPYRAFDLEGVLGRSGEGESSIDLDDIPEHVDFGELVGSGVPLDRHQATMDLLVDVRDRLRTGPGVNAFLAVDVDILLSEVDAATQSIEFALASNAVVYVVPGLGDNLGVGIEVGAVLEAIYREEEADARRRSTRHRERVLFVHESGVESTMIAAVRDRWDARVYRYRDRAGLVKRVRLFVRDVARRERHGELASLD